MMRPGGAGWLGVWMIAGCTPQPVVLPSTGVAAIAPTTLSLAPDEGEATLAVALRITDRSSQALPATWDTATLHLAHDSKLVTTRAVTLTKGVDLVASGSTFVANAVMGTLRPGSGYTLWLDLWNGGAGATLAAERQVNVTLAAGANAVTVATQIYPLSALTSTSPATGVPGSTIALGGAGISLYAENDQLTLGSGAFSSTCSFTVASSLSLTATVPELPPLNSSTWTLQVGSRTANRGSFSVLGILGGIWQWVSLSSHQYDPAIATGNGDYLATWYDDRINTKTDIYAKRIAADGNTLASDFAITNSSGTTQQTPCLAYDPADSRFLVIWSDSSNSGDIRGRIVYPNGTFLGADFTILTNSGAQLRPQVAFSPSASGFLTVWTDDRTGTNTIRGKFVKSDGSMLSSSFEISSGVHASDNAFVAYSSGANRFLVVWQEALTKKTILGCLVDTNGNLLGSPFEISSQPTCDQLTPSVATDGSTGHFFVVWAQNQNPSPVYAQRVSSADGSLIGGAVTLTSTSGTKGIPRVAYQPWRSKFLAVWPQNGSYYQIFGQYVGSDGALWGDTFVIAGTGSSNKTYCDVAADPISQSGMVSYQDAGAGGNIYGQRVR